MIKKLSIAALIIFITLFHFLTPTSKIYLHEIYQRLYYVPIIMASLWFSIRGSLIVSLSTSIAYFFHIWFQWHFMPRYSFNQYAEILIFNVVAIIISTLTKREKIQHQKYVDAHLQLQEAYKKLQQAYESVRQSERLAVMGELSASIAHEIRNPLASIKGSIDIISEGIKPDESKYEFVNIIKKEIDRLTKLTTEFLAFAKPEVPNKILISINDVINSLITLINKHAQKSNVKIETNLSSELPLILIDPQQIKQALMNILLNAIQAMEEGGTVKIDTNKDSSNVIISITDQGPGIPEEMLPKIFDPFFTTKTEGTGLGLSISYQLIKQHNGNIIVESSNKGTVFKIFLPI